MAKSVNAGAKTPLPVTCFPEFPVPEDGHDDQQVPDNIHHDGRDEHAGQHRHHPGEGVLLRTRGPLRPRRRGVARLQSRVHRGGLMLLQGHQLREVPRVDESHWVVAAEGRSVQHDARGSGRAHPAAVRSAARNGAVASASRARVCAEGMAGLFELIGVSVYEGQSAHLRESERRARG